MRIYGNRVVNFQHYFRKRGVVDDARRARRNADKVFRLFFVFVVHHLFQGAAFYILGLGLVHLLCFRRDFKVFEIFLDKSAQKGVHRADFGKRKVVDFFADFVDVFDVFVLCDVEQRVDDFQSHIRCRRFRVRHDENILDGHSFHDVVDDFFDHYRRFPAACRGIYENVAACVKDVNLFVRPLSHLRSSPSRCGFRFCRRLQAS